MCPRKLFMQLATTNSKWVQFPWSWNINPDEKQIQNIQRQSDIYQQFLTLEETRDYLFHPEMGGTNIYGAYCSDLAVESLHPGNDPVHRSTVVMAVIQAPLLTTSDSGFQLQDCWTDGANVGGEVSKALLKTKTYTSFSHCSWLTKVHNSKMMILVCILSFYKRSARQTQRSSTATEGLVTSGGKRLKRRKQL